MSNLSDDELEERAAGAREEWLADKASTCAASEAGVELTRVVEEVGDFLSEVETGRYRKDTSALDVEIRRLIVSLTQAHSRAVSGRSHDDTLTSPTIEAIAEIARAGDRSIPAFRDAVRRPAMTTVVRLSEFPLWCRIMRHGRWLQGGIFSAAKVRRSCRRCQELRPS